MLQILKPSTLAVYWGGICVLVPSGDIRETMRGTSHFLGLSKTDLTPNDFLYSTVRLNREKKIKIFSFTFWCVKGDPFVLWFAQPFSSTPVHTMTGAHWAWAASVILVDNGARPDKAGGRLHWPRINVDQKDPAWKLLANQTGVFWQGRWTPPEYKGIPL